MGNGDDQDHRARGDLKDPLVHRVPRVPEDKLVHLVPPVFLEPKVIVVSQGYKAT